MTYDWSHPYSAWYARASGELFNESRYSEGVSSLLACEDADNTVPADHFLDERKISALEVYMPRTVHSYDKNLSAPIDCGMRG